MPLGTCTVNKTEGSFLVDDSSIERISQVQVRTGSALQAGSQLSNGQKSLSFRPLRWLSLRHTDSYEPSLSFSPVLHDQAVSIQQENPNIGEKEGEAIYKRA